MRSAPVMILLALLVLGTVLSPLPANEIDYPGSNALPPALLANWFMDTIIGNRTRMVQVTFVAFGIGILILVTSTRKH